MRVLGPKELRPRNPNSLASPKASLRSNATPVSSRKSILSSGAYSYERKPLAPLKKKRNSNEASTSTPKKRAKSLSSPTKPRSLAHVNKTGGSKQVTRRRESASKSDATFVVPSPESSRSLRRSSLSKPSFGAYEKPRISFRRSLQSGEY